MKENLLIAQFHGHNTLTKIRVYHEFHAALNLLAQKEINDNRRRLTNPELLFFSNVDIAYIVLSWRRLCKFCLSNWISREFF